MSTAIGVLALAVALTGAATPPPLDSRPLSGSLSGSLADMPAAQPTSFDLDDLRAELAALGSPEERDRHSVFKLRRHVGSGVGYDSGVLHASVGLYVTVAEIGRMNLGVTSPAIGFSRFSMFDQRRRGQFMKTETTILVSLASVHVRGGYLQSLRKNWYLSLEQVFDARTNMSGSQVGLSFSGR